MAEGPILECPTAQRISAGGRSLVTLMCSGARGAAATRPSASPLSQRAPRGAATTRGGFLELRVSCAGNTNKGAGSTQHQPNSNAPLMISIVAAVTP
jgi:hypothetical protein